MLFSFIILPALVLAFHGGADARETKAPVAGRHGGDGSAFELELHPERGLSSETDPAGFSKYAAGIVGGLMDAEEDGAKGGLRGTDSETTDGAADLADFSKYAAGIVGGLIDAEEEICLLPNSGSAMLAQSLTGVSWVEQDVYDDDGNIIGTNTGQCSMLPQSPIALCYGTFSIGGDIVMLQGMADFDTGLGTFGVAGGTGCYTGATGGYAFGGDVLVSPEFTFTLM